MKFIQKLENSEKLESAEMLEGLKKPESSKNPENSEALEGLKKPESSKNPENSEALEGLKKPEGSEKLECRIECRDALELLAELPNQCADAIITDPPYFQGMTMNGKHGTFSDLAISRPFWVEFYQQVGRILKPSGAFYQFSDWRGFAFYYPIMDQHLGIRNCLVWDKGPGPGAFYSFSHELILFWTPNNQWTAKRKGAKNVIRSPGFSQGAKRTNGPKVHPTQKPLELIEGLILDATNPGELVLDPFLGSGTTALASLRLGRRFIGSELQEKYLELTRLRLEPFLPSN